MALRHYYFEASSFDLSHVQARVPTAVTKVVPSPGGSSFLIVTADDVFQTDLFSAMTDEGFTFVFSSLLAPPAFGQSRLYGALAADPVSPPFPAPAAGDLYWNTTLVLFRVYDGAAWVGIVGSDTAVLSWGNDSVAATVTTRFLTPWYEDALAQTAAIRWRVPRSGTLRNLRVRHNITAGNGNAIVYTLRVNGVATLLSVSLASTAVDGSNLVNTVVVAAGDLVDIIVTKAVAIGTSPNDIVADMEFV